MAKIISITTKIHPDFHATSIYHQDVALKRTTDAKGNVIDININIDDNFIA